jgi:4-hydroxy-tetrahydrodipicolinate reductase
MVGAVDHDPNLQGRDVGELAGAGATGIRVVTALDDVGPPGSFDVVVHCTGSHLDDVEPQILDALRHGAAVVSTCEELSYPWYHHPDAARRIDEAAKAARRPVLGTGINPGFSMDLLPLAVTGVSERVDHIGVRRVVDAAMRRGPLQHKVGAGISVDEFDDRRHTGRIGHVGLIESVAMLAAGVGWTLDGIEETLEPVVAKGPIETDFAILEPGAVAGIRQIAIGTSSKKEVIHLQLDMYVGAQEPGDVVTIRGVPEIRTSSSGFHGDVCTAAVVANAVAAMPRLRPGLLTVLDLVLLRGEAR